MKNPPSVGLLAAGPVSRSPLVRLPLMEHVRVVKGPTLRVASRIVNRLHIGAPARDYAALDQCDLLLLAVPDTRLHAHVEQLAQAPLRWNRKSVLLWSPYCGTQDLAALAQLGATTASFCLLDISGEQHFIVEGDRLVLNPLRSLLAVKRTRWYTVQPSAKALLHAGVAFCSTLYMPLLAASVDCLQGTGLSSHEALALMEAQSSHALRTYARAGRRALPAYKHDKDRALQLEALRRWHPDLADYYMEGTRLLHRFMPQSGRTALGPATQ